MTFTEIKEEVPKLTLEEKMELAEILLPVTEEDDAFDAAIRADIEAEGPLFQLGEKALAKFKRGECLPGFP